MRRAVILASAALVACGSNGGAPVALLSARPAVIKLGEITVGSVARAEVTLLNNGNQAVPVLGVEIDPGLERQLRVEGLPERVVAGATRKIEIVVAPDTPGSLAGRVRFVLGDGPPLDLTIEGSALGDVASFEPSHLDFGLVALDASRTATIAVTNHSASALELTTYVFQGSASFRMRDQRPRTLRPGERVELGVSFTPGLVGPNEATLQIGSGDRALGPVPVRGTGLQSLISIEPSEIVFSRVLIGDHKVKDVRLASNARQAVRALITVEGDLDAFTGLERFLAGPIVIESAEVARVPLGFRPTERGPKSALLSVSIDGGPTIRIALLSGVGVIDPGAALVAEPPALEFGPAQVGARVRRSLWITNISDLALALTATASIVPSDAPIDIGGEVPLGAVLTGRDRHRLEIGLTPPSVGPGAALLTIGALEIPVRWTGVARAVAQISAPEQAELGAGRGLRVIEIESAGTATVVVTASVSGGVATAQAIPPLAPGGFVRVLLELTGGAPFRAMVRFTGGESPVDAIITGSPVEDSGRPLVACVTWDGDQRLELHAVPSDQRLRDAPFSASECQQEIEVQGPNSEPPTVIRSVLNGSNSACLRQVTEFGPPVPVLVVVTAPRSLPGTITASLAVSGQRRSRVMSPGTRWDAAIIRNGEAPTFLEIPLGSEGPRRCY